MSKVEDFLTKAEEQEVVEAIRLAEKNTSGEIRVHLEKKSSVAAVERATEIFNLLKMQETQHHNGVLIYVAVKTKQFAIYGDSGINQKVPSNFWDSTKNIMLAHFKTGNQKQALIDGIAKAGEQLKVFFPFDQNNDSNELSNEISKG